MKFGVWEDDRFIGTVIYGRGANNNMARQFGLDMTEACELVRVALTRHKAPVTRIISISMKMLKKSSPGLRLIVSYADPIAGHVGGIYQAGNWIYIGTIQDTNNGVRLNGKVYTPRSVSSKYGTRSIPWLRENVAPDAENVHFPAKHKYVFPLDEEIRKQLLPQALPYPKKQKGSVSS